MDAVLREDPEFKKIVEVQTLFIASILSIPPAFREEMAEFTRTKTVKTMPQEVVDFCDALAKFWAATDVTAHTVAKATKEEIIGRFRKELEAKGVTLG